jgi:uncharacterized iron-regulated protein
MPICVPQAMNPALFRLFATALTTGALGFTPAAGAADNPAPAAHPGCLTPGVWSVPEGERPRIASGPALLAEMARRDVVLLGERHDEDDHHRWQLHTLAALHALRPHMVIGFEMFPRRVQPALDRWVAGELTVKQFLEQTEWDKVWDLPAELYLPLFQFARINRIPMVALNVERKLNKAISDQGWDAVPEGEREGVGRPAPPSEAYRDLLLEVYREHGTVGGKDVAQVQKGDRAFRNFVESQITWDRAMAEGLARQAAPRATGGKPLVVGIMGSGHIRYGYGVPHQLRDLGVRSIGTLLPLSAEAGCRELRAGLADAVFALPQRAAAAPEPPRLGVHLEEHEGGVRIASVSAGSLAERTGLKSGDRLIELAGLPVKGMGPVIAAVRRQPGGTWLPLRVQRGNETLEMVVKFPAKS